MIAATRGTIMAKELKPIDITHTPEVLRLAEEVARSGVPRVLRRDNQDVAVISPAAPTVKRHKRSKPTSESDPLWQIIGIADAADFPDTKRNALEFIVEPRPIRLGIRLGPPCAGDQVEARGLIRTLRPHAAGRTEVALVHEPDARQRDIRRLGQARHDASEEFSDRADLGQLEETFLERVKLRRVIGRQVHIAL